MALVKIACTCARCGQPFTNVHTCRNSAEASSYEAWARENITICPECLARAEDAAKIELIFTEAKASKIIDALR